MHFQETSGANHYMILDDMGAPGGQFHCAILNLLR
jgi:hypothetical protein